MEHKHLLSTSHTPAIYNALIHQFLSNAIFNNEPLTTSRCNKA